MSKEVRRWNDVLDAPAYELAYWDFDPAIQLLEHLVRGEK